MNFVRFAIVCLCVSGLTASYANAATQVNDLPTFLGQVAPGYYLETFDGVSTGTTADPLNFSSGGFTYDATVNIGNFFNVDSGGGDVWLSVEVGSTQDITFTFTSGNVTAVGGYFFGTNLSGTPTGGNVSVQLNDGTVANLVGATDATFVGFVSNVPITSITMSTSDYDAVNDLYVGSLVVPTPAAMPAGLIALGAMTLRRRRRVA